MDLFNKPTVPLQKKTADIRTLFPATSWIVFVSLVSAFTALLQTAGGAIPVAGMFISPLSTAPIIVMTLISRLYGLYTYTLTIILLVLIQPAEVLIFTFTTGLLGIGLGLGFNKLKRRFFIALSGCIFLFQACVQCFTDCHFLYSALTSLILKTVFYYLASVCFLWLIALDGLSLLCLF